MKRCLLTLIITTVSAVCQAQIGFGMRDTKYANVNFTLHSHYFFELEQSLYAEKPIYQYTRVYGGYKSNGDMFSWQCLAYYGMAWNNNYRNLGANIGLSYFYRPVGVYGNLNPHYDSLYGTRLFYRVGVAGRVSDEITLKFDYNTIPTYREGEKCLRAGAAIESGNLWVEPMVAIPLHANDKYKSMRVLVSLGYVFSPR